MVTGTVMLKTTATSPIAVGTYTISFISGSDTFAAPNYSFTTFIPGTLTVTAATVTPQATTTTLNFSPASPTYGTPVNLTAKVANQASGGELRRGR